MNVLTISFVTRKCHVCRANPVTATESSGLVDSNWSRKELIAVAMRYALACFLVHFEHWVGLVTVRVRD